MAESFLLVCDEVPHAVVLTDPCPDAIGVLQLVHRLTGLSLWRSKTLIGQLPAILLEDMPLETAESMVQDLLAAGAQAEVRRWDTPADSYRERTSGRAAFSAPSGSGR